MTLAPQYQPNPKPSRDELEALLYRFITLAELNNPEDLAAGRAVLHLDAMKHLGDNKDYYQQRFAQLRHS